MKSPFIIQRTTNQSREIEMQKRQADEAAARAMNILRIPFADTFLGRKHYELIPLPYETEPE